MTRALPLLVALVLMGQDCEPAPPVPPGPSPGGTDYCYGNEYTVLDKLMDGAGDVWNTIIGGESSSDRRATVRVLFGSSYCSGVALTPRTVLTAAHCGYGADTVHNVNLDGYGSELYASTAKVVHPEYLKYVNSGNTYYEGRASDIMVLYMDDPVPGPYPEAYYSSLDASLCDGLVAQGWGRWEESGLDLREAKYVITEEIDKSIKSRLAPEGKICFGDSGGPLYADVSGTLQLAGITSTTMSADCLTGGTHVKVAAFDEWLQEVVR